MPEGVRSGSAVTNVRWQEANSVGNYPASYSGEATVVDLGNNRYLFALIGEATKQIAAHTLHEELGEQRSDYKKLLPKVMSFRDIREVPRDHYPLLVTFTDINDPATVRRVDPNDLTATFGPGVSLMRITLEISDEPVTGGIKKVLGWLATVGDGMLDGRRISTLKAENRLANDLSRLNFKRE